MSHAHGAEPSEAELADLFTRRFWDDRYASAEQIWSGRPNQRLVEQTEGLAPGDALDVGSGEGADAIWLAARGWRVTGVDVSTVALVRAAAHAAAAGPDVAGRITWLPVDLFAGDALPGAFDLVTASFMHLPRPQLSDVHRRMAAAVRPGGTLLVVGHHPADHEGGVGRFRLPDLLFTPDEVVAALDPGSWRIEVAEAATREAVGPEGDLVLLTDTVVRAVRA